MVMIFQVKILRHLWFIYSILICVSSGLYYKSIMIINNTSIVVRMMIISDAPSCGVTYDHQSDNSRGVIHAPREHL